MGWGIHVYLLGCERRGMECPTTRVWRVMVQWFWDVVTQAGPGLCHVCGWEGGRRYAWMVAAAGEEHRGMRVTLCRVCVGV